MMMAILLGQLDACQIVQELLLGINAQVVHLQLQRYVLRFVEMELELPRNLVMIRMYLVLMDAPRHALLSQGGLV